jgi:hypothetical protein
MKSSFDDNVDSCILDDQALEYVNQSVDSIENSFMALEVLKFLRMVDTGYRKKEVVDRLVHYALREYNFYCLKEMVFLVASSKEKIEEYLPFDESLDSEGSLFSNFLTYYILIFEIGFREKFEQLMRFAVKKVGEKYSREHIIVGMKVYLAPSMCDKFVELLDES